jgi:predicted HTH transcriptional regulator
MHIIDDWGTGIQKIIEGCKSYGISEPEFIELGASFRVNIYRDNNPLAVNGHGVNDSYGNNAGPNDPNRDPNDPNRDPNKINENIADDLLIKCIKNKPDITYEEIAIATNLSRKTVQRRIRELKDKGKIKRTGGTRGSWEVATNGKFDG